MELISYQIDGHDEITAVSDSWTSFAASNAAADLTEQVVGHSMWDFVCGDTTRQVYRDLLTRVRDGRTVTFSYRCDSFALRRFMQMTMTPGPRNGVHFDSLILRIEPRVPPIFTGQVTGQIDPLLLVCSWCKLVAVGEEWDEVEVAIERLGLFAGSSPPAITHGMCPSCVTRILGDDHAA